MKNLRANVIGILGEKGVEWINTLSHTLNALSDRWELKNIVPVENMSYNYVAKAITSNDQPVVLKVGFDKKAILDEKQALSYFDGNGAIRFLKYDEQYNALLLEQAIPGTTLKSYYPTQEEFVIDCYVDAVKQLHNQSPNRAYSFQHIENWLKSIDEVKSNQIPDDLLKKAVNLKNVLLSTMKKEIILHGDLHHDNILKNHDKWIVIDPKGIIGEAEFEMAAFDFISANEMKGEVKGLFDRRLQLLSKNIQLNPQRIRDWVFVRLILSAAWHIEDGGNPAWAIELSSKII